MTPVTILPPEDPPSDGFLSTPSDRLRAIMGRRHLVDFIKYCRGDYICEPFHETVCGIMERFYERVRRRESPRVIIVAPPQSGKSEIVSRFSPAWFFGRFVQDMLDGKYLDEEQEFSGIFSTYSDEWASDLSRDVERIMDTESYTEVFADQWMIDEQENPVLVRGARIPPKGSQEGKRTADQFELIGYAGRYKSVGRGQPPAGRPANFVIIDDFLKGASEALSDTILETCWRSYKNDLLSRLQRGGGVVIMHTRWAIGDLIGRVLKDAKERGELDQWEVYVFPAIGPVEPTIDADIGDRAIVNRAAEVEWLGPGQSLTPVRFPAEEWLKKMGPCNPAERAALYFGSPIALSGNILPADKWNYYGGPGQPEFPDLRQFETIVASWDLSFKDATTSDFCAGQVWGLRGSECWLFPKGYVLELMSYTRAKQAIREQHYAHSTVDQEGRRYCYISWTFVEDAANGPAIISDLKAEIPNLIPVTPEGGKITRAWNASGALCAGNCFLPDPSIAHWVGEFVQRCRVFPANIAKTGSDDDVDAFTQMVAQRKRYQFGLLKAWEQEAMNREKGAAPVNPEPLEGESPEEFARRITEEQAQWQMQSLIRGGTAMGFGKVRLPGTAAPASQRQPSGEDGLMKPQVNDKTPKCPKCGSFGLSMTQGHARCACGWSGRLPERT
jgi:predicted phage terminase large subunit-like protein